MRALSAFSEIVMRGTHRFHEEFAWATKLICERRIDVRPIITATFPLGESAADLVLLVGELVVEHVYGRDAGPRGGQRQVVRAMRDGQIERPASETVQLGRALDQGENLPRARGAGVAADRDVIHPVAVQVPQRLRIVPRGDLDLVAGRPQPRDYWSEDHRMGRSGHIEPNPHAEIS